MTNFCQILIFYRKKLFKKIHNSNTKKDIFMKFKQPFILIKYNICRKFQTSILKIVFFIGKKVKNLKKNTFFFQKNTCRLF